MLPPRHKLFNLTNLVAYIISPMTFLLTPIAKILHPDVDVTILGLVITILSTIVLANIPIQDLLFRLFQWTVWDIAWVWLVHSEYSKVSQVTYLILHLVMGFQNGFVAVVMMLGVVLLEPVFYLLTQATNDDDYLARGHYHVWKWLAGNVRAGNECVKAVVTTWLSCFKGIQAVLELTTRTPMESKQGEQQASPPPPYTVSALFGRCFFILTVAIPSP